MTKKSRRQNGEGTIKLRKDGRYEAQIVVGKGSDGKLIRKSVFARSMAELVEKKTKLLNDVQTGNYIEPTRITLSQWLDQWLSVYQEGNISRNFYVRRKDLVRLHVSHYIGNIPLQKLRPINIQSLYKQLQEDGKITRKKTIDESGNEVVVETRSGLATGTIKHIHNIIKPALRQAVNEGLITKNPASDIKPPRIVRTREARVLNKEQAGRYLETLKEHRLYAAFLLEMTTGLRRGELIGLQWKDLDMEKLSIKIRRQVNRISQKDGSTILDYAPLKTPAAYRTIVLPSIAISELKRYKKFQAVEKLKAGKMYKDEDLLFCTPTGEKLDTRYLYRVHTKALKDAGIDHTAFHNLRHSVATLLLQAGESIKTVQDILGHSDAETTLNCYSHVIDEMRYSAADKIETIFKDVLAPLKNDVDQDNTISEVC